MPDPGPADDRLSALLLSRGVPAEDIRRCRTIAQARGCSLSQALVAQGVVRGGDLRALLAGPAPSAPRAQRAALPTVASPSGPERTEVDAFGPSGGGSAELPPNVGPFQIKGLIAEGGMGMVYRAYHSQLQREVALKVLSPQLRLDDETRERFVAEARMAARVGQHPGLVRVYDAGCDDDLVWMAMELVEGSTLQERVDAKPRAPREDAALLLGVCDALTHVHAHGIIHRDLKPPNVLIDRSGRPKLSDFGIAKSLSGGGSLTTTGSFLGTPAYMPPEQAEDSRNVDARSDVYGVGAILYALLTGRAPFVGGSAVNIMARLLNEVPPLPAELDPDVDPALEQVCLRAIERDPEDRYADVAELRAALQSALDGGAPALPRPSSRRRAASSGSLRKRGDSGQGRVRGDSGQGRVRGDSARLGKRNPSQRLQPGSKPSPGLLLGGVLGLAALGLALFALSTGGSRELPAEELRAEAPSGPLLTIQDLTPAPGLVPGPKLTLRGKATAEASLIVAASPRGHDAAPPPPLTVSTRGGTFAAALDLADGAWTVTVSTTAGRLLGERSFTLDSAGPRIEVDPPPTETEAGSLVLAGAVIDPHQPTLRLGARSVELGAGGRFSLELPLAPGKNALHLEALDAVGNKSDLRLVVDRTPAPFRLLPKQGVTVRARGTPYTLEGRVKPASARVFVQGRAVEVDAAGVYRTRLTLSSGENAVPIRAESDGQTIERNLIVLLDDRPPSITLRAEERSRTREVTLALGFSEDVLGVRITRTGQEAPLLERTFDPCREKILAVTLPEGESRLRIQARDGAGHQGSLDATIFVDSQPPKLTWTQRGKRIRIEASDPSGVTVELNGQPLVLKKGVASRPTPSGQATLVAVDGLGNRTTSQVTQPLFLLQDRERWLAAPAADQEREIDQAAALLGGAFAKLPTAEFACGALRHRLGRFRHEKTGVLFHLLPGGKLQLGSDPLELRAQIPLLLRENLALLQGVMTRPEQAELLGLCLLDAESPRQAPTRVAPFLIAQRELTRGEWIRGGLAPPQAPPAFAGEDQPVCPIAPADADAWLSRTTLRLPSELEWEYACRAGSETRFFWGDRFDAQLPFLAPPGQALFPQPVSAAARLEAEAWNGFGLVDTLGNAEELCSDAFTWSLPGGQGRGRTFPWQAALNLKTTNEDRVVRGGNRLPITLRLRASARFFAGPGSSARASLGLRLAHGLHKAKTGR